MSIQLQYRNIVKVCTRHGTPGAAVTLLLLLALSFLSSPIHAESRALIIGVGEYENDGVTDLPGLDIDVNIMKRVALGLGYKESAIMVLQDSDATIDNIYAAFDDWLTDGVTADDQVLIYFTGHGSQLQDRNGDEDDGLDEFFLAHDFRIEDNLAKGALVDDDFYKVLSLIPTDNIMLIVDACHSGTGFKSFSGGVSGAEGGIGKYHPMVGNSSEVDSSFAGGEKGSSARFVALMAADDTEVSIATARGSVFTLGIQQALGQSLGAGKSATAQQIIESTREFVKSELASHPDLIFTPQIGGDPELIARPLSLVPAASLRSDLLQIAGTGAKLTVTTNQQQYALGERSLKVTVDVPMEGYVNVVTVDPNDKAVVLFPNRFNTDNRVKSGALTLPTPQMSFDLEAQGPVGEHLIIAFWTPHELNMYTDGIGARSESGAITDVFSELSEYSTTRFRPVARENGTQSSAGWVTVEMVD